VVWPWVTSPFTVYGAEQRVPRVAIKGACGTCPNSLRYHAELASNGQLQTPKVANPRSSASRLRALGGSVESRIYDIRRAPHPRGPRLARSTRCTRRERPISPLATSPTGRKFAPREFAPGKRRRRKRPAPSHPAPHGHPSYRETRVSRAENGRPALAKFAIQPLFVLPEFAQESFNIELCHTSQRAAVRMHFVLYADGAGKPRILTFRRAKSRWTLQPSGVARRSRLCCTS
jgi:hypothetical protein